MNYNDGDQTDAHAEKILVVDDDPKIREVLAEKILPLHGFNAIGAPNADEALRILESDRIDLLIVDMRLPLVRGGKPKDNVGLEIVDAIRQKNSDVPIILMTAHGSVESAIEAFRKGVKDYIIKSTDVENIPVIIEKALYEARLKKENEVLLHQFHHLHQVGKVVASVLDQEELLRRIVEAGVFIMRADGGFLAIQEGERLYLRALKVAGDKKASIRREAIDDGSFLFRATRYGKASRVYGPEAHLPVAIAERDVKSLICIPLIIEGKPVGALCIYNGKRSRQFTQEDEIRLLPLADYAAIGLRNTQIFQEQERKTAERFDFISKFTHDLRIELQYIGAHAALIREGAHGEVNEEQTSSLDIIIQSTAEMNYQIGAILMAHAIEAKQIIMKEISLADIASRAMDKAEPVARIKNIEITLDAPDDLPYITGDYDKLAGIFNNLLHNALKFTPAGGRVDIRLEEVGDDIRTSIADTGRGIPPEDIGRIFERGLGLPIVKDIVRMHGGHIEVESAKDKGTTFTFTIPRQGRKNP